MNRKPMVFFIITMLCAALVGTALAQSEKPEAADAFVPAAFSYQGQIKRNGALFTGTCDMQFKLWDAAAAGTQQGAMLPVNGVSVANGVFAVALNFGNQFTGQARWVEASAKCANDAGFTTLPRVALNATPYAIGLMPGAQVQGSIPGGAGIFRAVNTGQGAALVGLANSNTGATYGVLGNAFSPNGYAVLGYADGGATGVRGESDSTGAGVSGRSSAGIGVYGESSTSTAVYGKSTSSAGVVGESGPWVGVYGKSTSYTGVEGKSATGAGVAGTSTAWVGVYGASTDWIGVLGESTNQSGGTFKSQNLTGVWAESASPSWAGIYAKNTGGGLAAWFEGRTKTGVLEITGGSDLAELLDVTEAKAEPGTLMIIDADNPGRITISTRAYDTKVAGVVSGAGGVNPGLTLQQDGVMEGDTHVAIAGRVYVNATAINGAIQPGDLLTASDVPGHAMKATDRDRSQGAIIGKAMTGLDSGTGLVLVLVNLQ